MRLLSLLALSFIFFACDHAGSVAPTPATAAVPYAYTATATLPTGVTGTITTVSGFPASLTVTGMTVSGTPTWAEAGAYTINASGTVTAGGSWWRTSSWSGSAPFVVNPPAFTLTPATGFLIPGYVMYSNQVTITVTGTLPCAYSAQYPTIIPGLAQITVVQPSPQASDPLDTVTLQLVRETNLSYSGTLTVTLIPALGGPNLVVSIPVVAQ